MRISRHSRRRSAVPRPRGFTLLEVLVALAVVALALTALVRAATLGASALDRERLNTLGTFTAQNAISELRLRGGLPGPGRSEGEERQGPFRLRWIMTISSTDDPGIRRADVEVLKVGDPAEPVTTLSGFIGDR